MVPKPEVARQLGISERNLDRLFRAGELPVVEMSPRRVGALQSDVNAFKLSRRRLRSPAPAAVEAAQEQIA